jgi:hypothetical protein
MPWIDVVEVKAHLNKTSNADDGELVGFIDAACAVVEDLKGHVDLVSIVQLAQTRSFLSSQHHRRHWEHVLILTDTPVSSVTTVEFLPGDGTTTVIAEQDLAAGVYGWHLEVDVLHLPYRTGRFGSYQVTYKAGRDPVPGNYRLAALELVAHMWRNTQLTARPPSGGLGGDIDPEFIRGMAYALPFRVRELLGIYGSTVGPVGGVTLA